ncbi:hypothetical protein VTK26DRAFT_6768 [Humicola hyalothermophila]
MCRALLNAVQSESGLGLPWETDTHPPVLVHIINACSQSARAGVDHAPILLGDRLHDKVKHTHALDEGDQRVIIEAEVRTEYLVVGRSSTFALYPEGVYC